MLDSASSSSVDPVAPAPANAVVNDTATGDTVAAPSTVYICKDPAREVSNNEDENTVRTAPLDRSVDYLYAIIDMQGYSNIAEMFEESGMDFPSRYQVVFHPLAIYSAPYLYDDVTD